MGSDEIKRDVKKCMRKEERRKGMRDENYVYKARERKKKE
jgi:hypothetical protein